MYGFVIYLQRHSLASVDSVVLIPVAVAHADVQVIAK